ncbi:PREDICTED: uncharacterized protein LOC106894765 isoform X2 [Calidris pugnax]|uniref:uncharacterized protein LOC106894765 isoform X2 n=1 Tax=Calidris pugnax TaxID=198806 RepID=UPI00071DD8B7|nr:PREDICTED: uncharacterized protein LOC106894765 isoform X2 [Calidris pugnax]
MGAVPSCWAVNPPKDRDLPRTPVSRCHPRTDTAGSAPLLQAWLRPANRDEFLQGLGAGGDVTCSASPEPMFFVDFDAECEKERLLKDDRAGSPTAELSQGNMLFNTTRHRWTSHEPQAPGSSKELEGEEEPLLNAAGNRPATPVLLPPAPDPSDAVPAGRRESRRSPWLLWEKLGTAGSRWRRNPWKSLRSSERWGAAPDGPPYIGSPPGGECDPGPSFLPPTLVPATLSPVLKRSSAPAFSSSFPDISL